MHVGRKFPIAAWEGQSIVFPAKIKTRSSGAQGRLSQTKAAIWLYGNAYGFRLKINHATDSSWNSNRKCLTVFDLSTRLEVGNWKVHELPQEWQTEIAWLNFVHEDFVP